MAKNKYKAGDYKGSGMSKAQYEAYQKKKTPSKSTSSKDTASSFDYKSLGITKAAWDALGSAGQSAMAIAGRAYQKRASQNQPVPVILDSKEMNKLWEEAKADPVINTYYANELNVAKDVLAKNTTITSANFKQLTAEQQRQYIKDKQALDTAKAAAGQAYSGIRGQAKKELDISQQDTISSTQRQLQQELDTLGTQFEQRYGSTALPGTVLGNAIGATDIGTFAGETYSGPAYGSEVYTPTGGVAGTQATDILAARLDEQKQLAAIKEQGKTIKNFKYNMLPS